ncbi:MAG: bifunctional precorrin-2 dehydrogenase/sirohydrochlorin ferrochelatase [Thermodesulfobacteriota bacterium]|nr:bifunctional precorrin-2 dehydrogenase/sirohydrochlorin ferrochelatase [Thermodesulfobacteriota bacterium]
MRYYPVSLDIKNRKCLVVGGGAVGTRKVRKLVECGAKVTVVSPHVKEKLLELAGSHSIVLKKRAYRATDLDGMFLVMGTTDDEALNRKISEAAEKRNILCNIADCPQVCNFILPSIVHRGDLTISISTSGKSPALAKKLRLELEGQFGSEYAELLCLMGAIRKNLLSQKHQPEAHKRLFEQLIGRGLLNMIRDRRKDEIDSLLREVLGEGFEFDLLMETGI